MGGEILDVTRQMSPDQFKIEDIRYIVKERCQRIYLPSEYKVEEEIKAI